MKKIISLIFILSSFLIAKGNSRDTNQLNISNRFSIGLLVGPSIPGNSFGVPSSFHVTYLYDTISGFAKTGFHFELTPKIYLTPHFGLVGLLGGNLNSFNSTAYNNSISYSENRTSTSQANNYYSGEYMGGLFFSFPMGETPYTSFLHLAIMCGEITTNFPTITTAFSSSPTQSAGVATLSAQNTNSFGWNLNAGLDFKINEKLFISFDISYSFANMNYPNAICTETLQGGPTYTVAYENALAMSLGLVKPTVGIGYIF